MIACDLLDAPRVRHGFFTREGGVSQGIFASLNCGFGSHDLAASVSENRRRVAERLGVSAERLVTLYQVHSPAVVRVERPWTREAAPRADAMVTREPGVALGILTADCAPVLLAEAGSGVIGACHAGWRGALAGVIDATVAAMCDVGARRERIRAAVGPAIGKRSYEVGPEFPAPFLAEDPGNAAFFREAPRAGHHLFDLVGYALHRLGRLGIGGAAATGGDTLAEPARFFSYRRACLGGERDYGRLISAIALEP